MTEVIHRSLQMSEAELADCMLSGNHKMYAWPVLARKAINTLLHTRNGMATMFAWNSNLNYRHVGME